MPLDDTDLPDDDFDITDDADADASWTLDELEGSAELGSLRSARAAGDDGIDG